MINLPDLNDDEKEQLIEEASYLFLLIEINMKDAAVDHQLVHLKKL